MSEERDEWDGFETVAIAAKGSWVDPIELTLYENRAPFAIRIGLGHTVRKMVHVVIDKATEEDEQKLKLKMLEGEVISE